MELLKMENTKASVCWQVSRIPGEPEHKLTTVKVYAAKIDPKTANTLVRELNSKSPLPSLGHVRRIQRSLKEGILELSVILCTVDELDVDGEIQLSILISEIVNRYNLEPFVASVAELPANTREEWETQCQFWPTSYHPNSGKSAADLELGQAETITICNFMEKAVEQARLAQQHGLCANGAVIVDPASRKVVARAYDKTSALFTPPGCGSDFSRKEKTGEKLDIAQINGWHPLQHAVMNVIQLVAERDKQLWPAEQNRVVEGIIEGYDLSKVSSYKRQQIFEATTYSTTSNAVKYPMDNAVARENSTFEIPRPYLCTNFDLYVTREPCAMCAMAMVHQRFRRVIYGISNERFGALGSHYKLHGLPSLNHHYTVFQVSLSEADLL